MDVVDFIIIAGVGILVSILTMQLYALFDALVFYVESLTDKNRALIKLFDIQHERQTLMWYQEKLSLEGEFDNDEFEADDDNEIDEGADNDEKSSPDTSKPEQDNAPKGGDV